MNKNTITLFMLTGLMLNGCQSESTSTTDNPIAGLASFGGAIKGQISLAQPQGSTPSRTAAAMISTDGHFSLNDATALQYPTLLKIDGVHGVSESEEFSILLDADTTRINLSPLTRLIIGRVAGVDANTVFEQFANYHSMFTEQAINAAQNELKTVLEPLLSAANLPDDIDFFSAQYAANAQDLDSVLSTLRIEYFTDRAEITYRPNKEHSVTLPYREQWDNLSLLPNNSDTAQLAQQLNVVYQAKEVLESMILLRGDRSAFEANLAPQAHWFGSPYERLHEEYFTILPAENNPNLSRYRDLVLLASLPEQQRYLIGYTTAFEASKTASVSRDQAWFEYVDGELKFLGDDQAFPTSFYALYKLSVADKAYNWDEQYDAFQWVFETSGFLAAPDCEQVALNGEWQWGNPDFIASLTSVGDIFEGLQYIEVTSPTSASIKFDKIFRDPSDESCHLVDSTNGLSGMLDGYPIDLESNHIASNQQYTASYVYEHQDQETRLEKTLYLTEPPADKAEMAPYLAQKQAINGEQAGFFYQWQRDSQLVEEGDLYVYFADFTLPSERVTIAAGKQQVAKKLPDDVVRVFHNGFDPFGRIITHYYVSRDGVTPLQ